MVVSYHTFLILSSHNHIAYAPLSRSLHLCIFSFCAQLLSGLAASTNPTGSSSGVHGDVGRSSEPEAAEDGRPPLAQLGGTKHGEQ